MAATRARAGLHRLLPALRPRTGLPVAAASRPVPGGFTPLRELRPFGAPGTSYDHAALRRRRWHDLDGRFGFALVVLLPTIVAAIYYGFVAAPRYVSESEFVLRSVGKTDTSAVSALVAGQGGAAGGGGAAMGGDRDAQAVSIFVASHDGMAAVDRAVGLRAVFGRPEADRLSRFPGVMGEDTDYALLRYWRRMVSVSYDPTTSVVKLAAQSFRPDDAKAINDAAIASAEALVNRMDLRIRREAVRSGEEGAAAAREAVVAAQQQLTAFRLKEQVIDPVKMSAVVIESISQLVQRNTLLKTQLSDMRKSAPANTQIRVLQNQIASIDEEIVAQQAKLTSRDGSLSPILADYARLSLGAEFANQSYTAALDTLESARVAAGRQHVFLERISGPTLADDATEPRRTLLVLLVFGACFCVWTLLRFALKNVRAHHGR